MRDSGHVDRYKNLRVKYIDHHNPDLVLLDKHGQETHRVDLTRLSSTHSIHKLCQLLGLEEICRDENRECKTWAGNGECERNKDYMSVSCRNSCNLCGASAEVAEPACKTPTRRSARTGRPWASASPTRGGCKSSAAARAASAPKRRPAAPRTSFESDGTAVLCPPSLPMAHMTAAPASASDARGAGRRPLPREEGDAALRLPRSGLKNL